MRAQLAIETIPKETSKAARTRLLDHYRKFSMFTNPGPYETVLREQLPDDIREVGRLVRRQLIHRVTLAGGNTGANADCLYGDMTKVPWWRQPEDDNLPTAIAVLGEIYRRDPRGFVENRKEEDKLILTCRFVAILMATILKSKGIPARVRSGFDPYASPRKGVSCDHWISQYWEDAQQRWVTIDVDCCFCDLNFDPFDMPAGVFDWSADVWLKARQGKVDPSKFCNAGGEEGMMPIAWELFYDFHCLMNNEIIYMHSPRHLSPSNFDRLSQAELAKIDKLAYLMQDPDKNFNLLCQIWSKARDFRLLGGSLL